MNDTFNPDGPKGSKKFIARTKMVRKGAGVSRGRNAGPTGSPGILRRLTAGFRLKLQLVWIMIIVFIIATGFLLFVGREEGSSDLPFGGTGITRKVPSVKRVFITPAEPTGRDILEAQAELKGVQDDKILFKFNWYRNDMEIEGAKGKTLTNAHFSKGDLIRVTAIPVMNAVEGKEVMSSVVRIKNAPPMMQGSVIRPQIAYAHTELSVDVEAMDPDHDEISFGYQWIRNGEVIHGQQADRLSGEQLVKGDRIQVAVTPFDGFEHGTALISTTVIVNNSPPRITSNPPSRLGEDGTFQYQVQAEDTDYDPLTFSLSSANPPGASINRENGLLVWQIPPDLEPGPSRLEVIVNDDDGAETSQWFSLDIQFAVTQR